MCKRGESDGLVDVWMQSKKKRKEGYGIRARQGVLEGNTQDVGTLMTEGEKK